MTQKTANDYFYEAQERTGKLVSYGIELIHLSENLACLRSTDVHSKIPYSYAAHTYNQLVNAMVDFHILRLFALWDKAESPRCNIPTVVDLLLKDGVDVICKQEIEDRWQGHGEFGNVRIQAEIDNLENTIIWAANRKDQKVFNSIQHARDKFIAHNLVETRAEQRGYVYQSIMHSDIAEFQDKTIKCIDSLHHALNGTGFMWDDSIDMAKRNAEEFWYGYAFRK